MPERKPATGSRDDLDIDVSRCLKMRLSESSCRRCVDICPHNAVTLDGGLAIQPECRGCLLCTTVCPVGALEPQGDFSLCLAQLARISDPVLGCTRTKDCSNATLSCLGGLAEEHLLVLHHTLTGRLTLNLTRCADCSNKPMIALLRQRLDAIFAAGLSGTHCCIVIVELSQDIHYRDESVDRRSFLKSCRNYLFKSADIIFSPIQGQSPRRSEYAEKRLPIRRELLNRTKNRSSQELEVRIGEHFDPSIVFAETCTSCQGCVAICPTGALQTGLAETPPTFIQLLCTGCGLCHEFCLDGAVRVIAGNNIES
jgi:Pyruvate/2-oxoacid:ferredoxin oxidoreductase delta subunit